MAMFNDLVNSMTTQNVIQYDRFVYVSFQAIEYVNEDESKPTAKRTKLS